MRKGKFGQFKSESFSSLGNPLPKNMPLEQSFRNLEDSGYLVRAMNGSHQIRINLRLDIYPKSLKWHDIKENRRGVVQGEPVEDFVSRYLGKSR